MNELAEIIKSRIRNSGPITFEDFMDLALYHQEHGYYTSGNVSIGREGDFYTSPYVHSAFGEVVSKFIMKSLSVINAPAPTIVEIGAGKGTLARDVLDTIKRENPASYELLKYIFIEKSPDLFGEASEVLKNHMGRVGFANSISDLENESVEGVVISNELFDAIPFHRAVIENGKLREIYVSLEDNNFIEITDDPSTGELKKYIDKYELELAEGQKLEINLRAGKTLSDISGIIRKGLLLTIDYGYLAPELYNTTRMNGTYKCMKGHTINENPYTSIGKQDITAHVDFTNLINEGKTLELNKIIYTTQGQFLIDWGILDVLEKMSQSGDELGEKKIAAVKNLFLPGSMGNQFKVLIQEKNLGGSLSGFYPESPLKISFDVL